jgi:predicted nucleotidyltransferase
MGSHTMMQSGHTMIQEFRERLTPLFARPDVRLVILFGSCRRGTVHRRSDIDVAILGDTPLETVETTTQVMGLLHKSEVDVVDLRRAAPLLAMEVVRSGTLLYERDRGVYASFCSLAHRRLGGSPWNNTERSCSHGRAPSAFSRS